MTDDVIHSAQYYIKYINRAILANLQRRPLKLGQLIVLQETHGYKKLCSRDKSLFSSPHPLDFKMSLLQACLFGSMALSRTLLLQQLQ